MHPGKFSVSLWMVVGLVLTASAASAQQRTATLPLDDWFALQAQYRALQRANRGAPNVVVTEARYEGKSDGQNLLMTLHLKAFIDEDGAEGPVDVLVLPTSVIVSQAREVVSTPAGTRVSVAGLAAEGAYLWQTSRRGPVELEVDFVVRPSGPRGSFEYMFESVEAVRTSVRCTFPDNNLVPRVEGAQHEVVTPRGKGVELYSVLAATSRIRITGFHDIEEQSEQEAKVYVDGQHLLSIEDDRAELFSVLRLDILYARKRRFQIELPSGYELVRANAEGAFRSQIETRDGKSVLVGEAATGMKDRYEISLRLRRSLKDDTSDVPVVIPRLLGAERETGTVALELPGRLTFEGHTGETLRPVDPRELPPTLIESSVSPIIAAFRYSDQRGPSSLKLRKVPAHPVAAGGIDRLEATTVITDDGRRMTDLRLTLRNLLRRHLAVTLPPGASVESAFLDGAPVKPSTVDGKILLPLARSSRRGSGLAPISVQLVYVQNAAPLGLFGRDTLSLPTFDVPISSALWTTYVPRRHSTAGDFRDAPAYVRRARFQRAQPSSRLAIGDSLALTQTANVDGFLPGNAFAATPGQGAMPIRVKIPTEGQPHKVRRDWVREGEAVTATLWHARIPVVIAVKWSAALALGIFLWIAFRVRRRRGMALLVGLGLGAGYATLTSVPAAILVLVCALAAVAATKFFRRPLREPLEAFGRRQWTTLWDHLRQRIRDERATFVARKEKMPNLGPLISLVQVGAKVVVGVLIAWLSVVVLGLGVDLIRLLSHPL